MNNDSEKIRLLAFRDLELLEMIEELSEKVKVLEAVIIKLIDDCQSDFKEKNLSEDKESLESVLDE